MMESFEPSSDEEEMLALALLLRRRKQKRKHRRSFWVRPLHLSREETGEFHSLVFDMVLLQDETFMDYFRMTPSQFDEVLRHVGPLIQRKDTPFRKSISPKERLGVTLRFLATRDSFTTIRSSYKMGKSTVCGIVHSTCKAIWSALKPLYMPVPDKQMWRRIATDFNVRWNFPHCMGAIDGKHVRTQCPDNGGSLFYNYKGFHSIVLMASCDAHYRYISIDVGAYGSESDGGIFADCSLGRTICNNEFDFPPVQNLPGTCTAAPWVFVADEAFPLRENLMRPFPGQGLAIEKKIYNYRLSRARRTIENAFGITAAKWRCFLRALSCSPEHVDGIVKAACVLHNFLRTCELSHPQSAQYYCPPQFADSADNGVYHPGQWREVLASAGGAHAFQNIQRVGSNNSPRAAQLVRDMFAEYFYEIGSVPWEIDSVNRTKFVTLVIADIYTRDLTSKHTQCVRNRI